MDNPQIKERSYRNVHMMRLKNQRENRLLYEKLYSKQGLHTSYMNELNAVTREQERIREELSRIRKTMTTTWGTLPTREQPQSDQTDSRRPGRLDGDRTAPGQRLREKKRRKRANRRRTNETMSNKVRSTDDVSLRGADPGLEGNRNERREERRETETLTLPSLSDEIGTGDCEMEDANQRLANGLESLDILATKTTGTKRSNQDVLSEKNLGQAKGKIMKRLAGADDNHQPSSMATSTSTKPNVVGDKVRKTNRKPILTPIEETQQEEAVGMECIPEEEVGTKKAFSEGDSLETTTSRKAQKKRRNSESNAFDSSKYNPDGSVRTVHVLPDMKTRMKEARKARYIRHKEPMDRERELSISEILGKESKDKEHMASETLDSTEH
ncbi:hypothetical protein LSH36_471g04006 [Paralvinella palmiformis]|uniref:Uncharacterized protein n=1 Tax=Paralvinella palmiformis TaxID=53620 RepID=A0AAD9J9K5_9ANNE|nr:hypothetical protein LSH36_471g04006 [Paralvinella palmiformis]